MNKTLPANIVALNLLDMCGWYFSQLYSSFYRVLVLNRGQVAEFDSPANLLADENSIFAGMVEESRLQTSDKKAQRTDFRRQLSNG